MRPTPCETATGHAKRCYETRAEADRALAAMLRHPAVSARDRRRLNVYKCECGFYHVGRSAARRCG